jgi:hypothetical protein
MVLEMIRWDRLVLVIRGQEAQNHCVISSKVMGNYQAQVHSDQIVLLTVKCGSLDQLPGGSNEGWKTTPDSPEAE